MSTRTTTLLTALVLSSGMTSTTAHADLQSRLDGLAVYDSDLNVTWLADANLAATNTFGVPGIGPGGNMNWTTAQKWIRAMNAAHYLGFNNWRLPATRQPDASCSSQSSGVSAGDNCTGSEMGHLNYTELGGAAGQNGVWISRSANHRLFKNLVGIGYWSGTEFKPRTSEAWSFGIGDGSQSPYSKVYKSLLAWPLRPGDVGATAIPPHIVIPSEVSAQIDSGELRKLIGSAPAGDRSQLILEARQAKDYCENNILLRNFYDCSCFSVKIIGARIEKGPDVPFTNLVMDSEYQECVDATKIAAYGRKRCNGSIGMMKVTTQQLNDICECAGQSLVKKYTAQPTPNDLFINGLFTNALTTCREEHGF